MTIQLKSILISFNNDLATELLNQKGNEIKEINVEEKGANDKLAKLMSETILTYVENSKGTKNLMGLNFLMGNLNLLIVEKLHSCAGKVDMEEQDMEMNEKNMEDQQSQLETRIKEMEAMYLESEGIQRELEKENQFKVECIRDLKKENKVKSTDLKDKEENAHSQKLAITEQETLKKKLQKKKRFLCC